MYIVYWSNTDVDGSLKPYSKQFLAADMSGAMEWMTELRKEETIHCVVMSSENPNSVGKAGAADVNPGYDWKKRRNNMPSVHKKHR